MRGKPPVHVISVALALLGALLGPPSLAERPSYVVLLVHGISSSHQMWDQCDVANLSTGSGLLNDLGFRYGGVLRFDLNSNAATETCSNDVRMYLPEPLQHDGDFYFLDFSYGGEHEGDSPSNESSIYKQGRAMGMAISTLLNYTGKRDLLILSHSMGGLAAREYLQRGRTAQGGVGTHWAAPDQNHHILKLITLDTPHLGSNQFGAEILPWIDARSEAVRDLRYDYSLVASREPNSQDSAVYLFGGQESTIPDWWYYNADVNCDDEVNTVPIQGLNTTDRRVNPQMPLPSDASYVWITGRCHSSADGGDGIVREDRQWVESPNTWVIHLEDVRHQVDFWGPCLWGEEPVCKKRDEIYRAMDEPDNADWKAYEVPIENGVAAFRGYVQLGEPGARSTDPDWYAFASDVNGEAVVEIMANKVAMNVEVFDTPNGAVLRSASAAAGTSSEMRFAVRAGGRYYLRALNQVTTTPPNRDWYEVGITLEASQKICPSRWGVDLGTVSGCQPPQQIASVTVTDCRGGVGDWSPRSLTPWVIAWKSDPTTLSVTADPCSLPAGGSYSGQIQLIDGLGSEVGRLTVLLSKESTNTGTATTVATSDGTLTLPSTRDCGGPLLRAIWDVSSEVAHSYLKFEDFTTVPAGSVVIDASAWLYATGVPDSGPVRLHEVTSPSDGCPAGVRSHGAYDSATITNSGWVEFKFQDLDEAVQDWINEASQCPGAENNGLKIRAGGQGTWVEFASSEYPVVGIRPHLDIWYEPNSPPVLDGIPDVTVDEGSEYCLDLWDFTRDAEDSSTSRLDYELVSNPRWVDPPNEHRLCIQPPEGTAAGTYPVRVVFTDKACVSDYDDFVVTVRAVDLPPSVTCVDPAAEDLPASGIFAITWSDHDLDSNALVEVFVLPQVAGATEVLVGSSYEDEGGAGGALPWDTSSFAEGRYSVRIRVSDGTSEASSLCTGSVLVDRGAPPVVEWTSPADSSADVETSVDIRVMFSKLMDPQCTVGAIQAMPAVTGAQYLAADLRTLVLDPEGALAEGVEYQVTISGSACDLAGRPLAVPSTFSFATATCCQDRDGDGYSVPSRPECPCPGPIDCDDGNAAVHPGAPETCNSLDDDCDRSKDEDLGTTTCGVGVCQRTMQNCVNGVPQACTPGTATQEICNGDDDDCDGFTDNGLTDTDADGLVDCQDNCPFVWNPDQSDTDGDLTGDICEPAALFTSANLSVAGFSSNRIDGRDLAVFAHAYWTCPGDLHYNEKANLDKIPEGEGACIGMTDFHLFLEEFAVVQEG